MTIRNLQSARVSIPPTLIKRGHKFQSKIDLFETSKYWKGWFEGMTQTFLDVNVHKMFMVSNRDQMDKLLIRTHMEGRFKLATLY